MPLEYILFRYQMMGAFYSGLLDYNAIFINIPLNGSYKQTIAQKYFVDTSNKTN